jgi:hypothetical protein
VPDLAKANMTEVDGDRTIRYDSEGKRHITQTLDPGEILAKMGLPPPPSVKCGPCLVTLEDGSVKACSEIAFMAPVAIIESVDYFLLARVKRPERYEVLRVMFPTHTDREWVTDALRRVLGATG